MFPLLLHVSTGDFESCQAGDFRAVPARLSRVTSPPPSSPKLRDRNQTVSGFKCAAAGQVSFLLLRPFVAVMSSESERMEEGRKEGSGSRGGSNSLSTLPCPLLRKQRTTTSKEASISLLCDGRTDADGRRSFSFSPRAVFKWTPLPLSPAAVMRVFLSVRRFSNFSRPRHCSGSFPRTCTVFMFYGSSYTNRIRRK